MQGKNNLQHINFKQLTNAHKNSKSKNQLSHFINQWRKYNNMEEWTWACLNGKRQNLGDNTMISNAGNDYSSNALRCLENYNVGWKGTARNSTSDAHKMLQI